METMTERPDVQQLKSELHAHAVETRTEFRAVRTGMRAGFEALDKRCGSLETELATRRNEMREGFARVDERFDRIEERFDQLLRFLLGASVLVIVALIGVAAT